MPILPISYFVVPVPWLPRHRRRIAPMQTTTGTQLLSHAARPADWRNLILGIGRDAVLVQVKAVQFAFLRHAQCSGSIAVSYTHLRAHETDSYIVCRLL